MTLLSQDGFLSELAKLFQKSKTESEKKRVSGSVLMTFKRVSTLSGNVRSKRKRHARSSVKEEATPDATDMSCLLRARYKHAKISTLVNAKDYVRFQMQIANILRVHLDGLKKKEKKKDLEKKEAKKTPKPAAKDHKDE